MQIPTYDETNATFSVRQYLEEQFGLAWKTVQDMSRLGFVLAGGAAAALVEVAHGREPTHVPHDVDFFYRGHTYYGSPLRGLQSGPATRSRAAIAVLKDGGGTFYLSSSFAITILKRWEEKPPVGLAKPQLETPAVEHSKQWQIIHVKEIGIIREDELEHVEHPEKFDPAVNQLPSWSRFDFSIIRAELDGKVLRYDTELLTDRARHNLRLRHFNRNPLQVLLRMRKYEAYGYKIPYAEMAKILVTYEQLSEKAKSEFRPVLDQLMSEDFRFEDLEPIIRETVYGGMSEESTLFSQWRTLANSTENLQLSDCAHPFYDPDNDKEAHLDLHLKDSF